jgi:hypothetical protein
LIGDDGFISPWKYKNIISVGIKLGHFASVEHFIDNYKEHLPPDYRDDAYNYNIANLAFHREQYKKALKALLEVQFSDIFYSLDTKKMMLKIYYEQGETEAFISLVAAFRNYLSRNELISDRNRLSYQNFLRAVQALYRLRHEQKGSSATIRALIDGFDSIVDKDWIEAKLLLP